MVISLKYYGTAFKVSTMGRYMVVVSGPDMLEDIRKATDEQLSFRDAVAEVLLRFCRTHQISDFSHFRPRQYKVITCWENKLAPTLSTSELFARR